MLCEIDRESVRESQHTWRPSEGDSVGPAKNVFQSEARKFYHLLWFEAKTLILLLPSLRCKEVSDRHSSGDSSHVIISFVMIIIINSVIFTLLYTALIKSICLQPDCKSPQRTQIAKSIKELKSYLLILRSPPCHIVPQPAINLKMFQDVSRSMWMTLIYAKSSDLASIVCIGAIPDKKIPICCCLWKVIISAISALELSPYDMRQPSFAGQSTFANVWKYERLHLLIHI